MNIEQILCDRFQRYVAISSQSDANNQELPSSSGQYQLAQLLHDELKNLGYNNITLHPNSILIAHLPGNKPNAKTLGFIAHLDTVDVGLSPNIIPQLLTYNGEPLCLNADQQIYISEQTHPELAKYHHQDIFFSNGTSVLGADDKAAIAVLMTLAEQLITTKTPHGDIYLAFVPDEEIGLRGAKALDLKNFPVEHCYTIDCCERGEVIYETFNAGSAQLSIVGITAHPMSAKNVLVNPNLIAADFISMLNDMGKPEQTAEREGYFWVTDISGNQNTASVSVAIRDFDQENYNARKSYLTTLTAFLRHKHPKADINITLTDVYNNISQAMGSNTEALTRLYQALENTNIPAKTIAMRGGTDGSALSVKGLFTPNFFTGAHNFHSAFEFLPIPSFVDSYRVAKALVNMA
ncbi:peptidase T [Photobacterium carnosum]|uniref:peptidase T n=1 Tax=Photobacterium carnosum TaxID=2023717 RepID=UPI001E4E97DA|nr:peptidase T [Photobacterium carnosum]MCD9537171.1 peptidase T [Photobacterium carnosum]MCF2160758.1 peptidase T [Photobacterium carnosum]